MTFAPIRQLGERLAWRAPCKQFETISGKEFFNRSISFVSDIPRQELRAGIVGYVRKFGLVIYIDACLDANACLKESVRKAAGTAEEIHGCNRTLIDF